MEKIPSVIINAKKYAIFLGLYMLIGTSLTTIISIQLNSIFLGLSGLFIFWVCPGIFQNLFRRNFTKNIFFNFSDDMLKVEILNKETDEIESIDRIIYSDIDYFRAIDSSKDDSSLLKINLKNGDSYTYTILGQRNLKTNITITDTVFKYFKTYNNLQENTNTQIKLKPNLFATKAGYNLIVCLSIILLGTLIFQIIYLPKSIPATFLSGLVLYVIILGQRKNDIAQSEKLKG